MKILCHLSLCILIGAPSYAALSVKNDFQSLSAQLVTLANQDKATEESGHVGFQRWCNGSLAAQSKRREDLKRLLEQAMPLAVGGEKLQMLQAQEQDLHNTLEQKRTAFESAKRAQKKRVVDAKLAIEDCGKDLEALQRAELQLSSGNPSASAISVGKMLTQALNEQRDRNQTLKDAKKPTMQESDLNMIEKKHSEKKKEVELLSRQRLAALKSQEVLLAALEDESEYLSDLQGLCDLQEQVHGRLQKEIYPILAVVGQKLNALPVATPPPPATVIQAAPPQASPAPVVSTPEAKPMTPHAKAAKSVLAVRHHAKVVAAAPPPPPPAPAPPPPPPPAPAPAPPPAEDAAPPPTTTTGPTPAPKPRHHHRNKRKHQKTTTTTTTSTTTTTTTTTTTADDDDDAPAPSPPPVSEKGWKPTKVAPGRKKATEMLAAQFDEEDDPDTPSTKAKVESHFPKPKPKKPKTALDQVAADFDSDDDDDDSSAKSKKSASPGIARPSPAPAHDDFDTSPSPAPAKHDDFDLSSSSSSFSSSSSSDDSPRVSAPRGFEGGWRAMMGKVPKHHHVEKKDPDEEIMDKIGDGALPASYTAWKPDDDNPAPAPAPPPPAPDWDSEEPAKNSATSRINKMSADLDSDDDSAPAPPPPPRHHHHHHHSDDDNDAPAPSPPPPSPAVDKIGNDLDKELDSGDSAAPSPAKVDTPASRLSAGASLDDDDSPAPSPPPPRRHHHHHSDDDDSSSGGGSSSFGLGFTGHHASSFSMSDPEPMTSVKPIRGFEGGWQAMMRHMPAKKHVHKDTDADLMEHLYDNNGALPASYTAWKPSDDDDKPKSSPASSAFAEAAASFDDDSDSFLQLSSRASMESPVRKMIRKAAEKKTQTPSMRGAILLEESSSTSKESVSEMSSSGVTEETINAAQLVLDMYSAVLDSPPLHQLSLSRLSVSELTDLWHKLQSVDPMTHPNIIAPTGQQAQAERWCQYFEQNQGSAAPQHQAMIQWEKADGEIADAAGKRAAILEELEARTQLQRTVSQDVRDLSALLQGVDREYGTMIDQLQSWVLQAGSLGVGVSAEGLALRDSVSQVREALSTSLTQLSDLVNQAVHKRSTVEARQRGWLSRVQIDAQTADKQWLQSTSQGSQWKSALEAAKKNLAGIEATCDTALESMERRRHAGRREMRAIRIALLVLNPQD